jgi:hypothetical protein
MARNWGRLSSTPAPTTASGRNTNGVGTRARARHVDGDLAGPPSGQSVQKGRELGRDARTDKHVIDPGEQGAVRGGGRGHLQFLHQVDPDKALMALLGQEDLDEAGRHRQVGGTLARVQRGPGRRHERLPGTDATGYQVTVQDLLGHAGAGEVGERPGDVASRVTELEPASHKGVQANSRDHAELTGQGDSSRQAPTGNADPHAPLDDDGASCLILPGVPGDTEALAGRAPDCGRRDDHQVLAGPLPEEFLRYQLRQMMR